MVVYYLLLAGAQFSTLVLRVLNKA
jgi:hypothetical protein